VDKRRQKRKPGKMMVFKGRFYILEA